MMNKKYLIIDWADGVEGEVIMGVDTMQEAVGQIYKLQSASDSIGKRIYKQVGWEVVEK